ncbi:uncharacterized protein LOC130673227 [Microplitis mediator]|uniref:uncharacterized protein LOC130673227 n=1 Tax=Microplitis mediator TaxID=375433 RepID=UPI00255585C5|nr:uncharacterized protein LOC130673227 [Microplitis mediator]
MSFFITVKLSILVSIKNDLDKIFTMSDGTNNDHNPYKSHIIKLKQQAEFLHRQQNEILEKHQQKVKQQQMIYNLLHSLQSAESYVGQFKSINTSTSSTSSMIESSAILPRGPVSNHPPVSHSALQGINMNEQT